MRIIQNLNHLNIPPPITLTIGNFDGVHLGHQAVLARMNKNREQHIVVTFRNHPSDVLFPEHSILALCTLSHKMRLLEEYGVDTVVLLTFTHELSQLTAESFLLQLRKAVPFTSLILGHDATLGRKKEGDQKAIQSLAKALNFDVEYIEEYSLDNLTISSSKIRSLIQEGHLNLAAKLLGRPYSIYSSINSEGQLATNKLCLPPKGLYAVEVIDQNVSFSATADLQPENHNLTIHFSETPHLKGKEVEVVFQSQLQ